MAKESQKSKTARSISIHHTLTTAYPGLKAFLHHKNAFELLIAVILSAQCTDERVNKTTPALFRKYPTPHDLAAGKIEEIADTIKSINFFNNKAKNIKLTSQLLIDNFKSRVPETLEELITLPGVGRKTANVVIGQVFDKPGITVDTHLKRVTKRLGFHNQEDPVKIEFELMKIWPDYIWSDMSTVLIHHGRLTCPARKPKCEICIIEKLCPKR